MSTTSYFLMPITEDDRDLIEIPEGKVIIGRGPFLRCTEKRVSRNHAELELTSDGLLYIKPLHINPTFHIKKGDDAFHESRLEIGKLCRLRDGDTISLLPNSLQFEVVTKPKRSCLDLDDVMTDQVDNSSEPNSTKLKISKNVVADDNSISEEFDIDKLQKDGIVENNGDTILGNELLEAKPRTRTLPDWMTEAAKNPVNNSTERNQTPKKKTSKTKVNIKESSTSVAKTEHLDDESMTEEAAKVSGLAKRKVESKAHKLKTPEIDSATNSESKMENVEISITKLSKCRQICEYGEKCYRKNPAHKEQFCHPGDDDYEMSLENSQDDDDKPECEYGTMCYRKNPQHRKAYKHTKKPPRTAVIKAKRRKEEDDSDDDEYDESFIDDDSDSYDPKKDDADYSSDFDDIGALNAEAKKFMKNKKL